MRMIQIGNPDDVVVLYHVHASIDAAVKAAAPGWAIWADTGPAFASYYKSPSLPPKARRLVLVGYSEGCQALRAHLLAARDAAALIAIDGMHASLPPHEPTQIRPWQQYAERARKGERVFVATHTRIATERVERPYLSTRATLRLVTGWALPEAYGMRREGHLLVHSYPGVDAEAHRQQQRDVLPERLREAIALLDEAPLEDAERVTPRSGRWEHADLSLGRRALEWGMQHIGITEVEGKASHQLISAWLGRCERGGKPLGLASDEIAWCAAFACACAYAAVLDGEQVPHGYRASVAEMWQDAAKASATRPQHHVPQVGDLAIFRRAGGDPRIGGLGHVARVVRVPDASGRYQTLDGNHANSVALVERVRDASLVGWIEYAQPAPPRLSPERAAELIGIGDAVMRGRVGLPDDEPPKGAA